MIVSKINPDLQKERNSATFNNHEFTLWWCGGQKKYDATKAFGKLYLSQMHFCVS